MIDSSSVSNYKPGLNRLVTPVAVAVALQRLAHFTNILKSRAVFMD